MSDSHPFVSFVVPVFNAGHYLSEAIASIEGQVEFDLSKEIIIVDDCSTDPITLVLLAKLKQQPDIRIISQPKNAGPASARNSGILAANGEWVCFLDADDFLLPDAMKNRMELLRSNPDAMWIAGNILTMPEIGKVVSNKNFDDIENSGHRLSGKIIYLSRPTRYLIHSPPPQVGSTMLKTACIHSSILFDESLIYGEEWYFWLHVSLIADLFWLETPTLVLRRHHESMMKNTIDVAQKMNRGSLKALFDIRFKQYRKDLRWRISSDYQWASKLFRENEKPIDAIVAATKALVFTPNSYKCLNTLWTAIKFAIAKRSRYST